jgi:hypothetical protein
MKLNKISILLVLAVVLLNLNLVSSAVYDHLNVWDYASQSNNGYGIATDNLYIYLTSMSDSAIFLYYMNGTYTGTSYDISSVLTNPYGITHYNADLYVLQQSSDMVFAFNRDDGTDAGINFSISDCVTDGIGITNDGTYFYITDVTGLKICKYDITGTLVTSAIVDTNNTQPNGIAYYDNNLYVYDASQKKIHVYNSTDLTIISESVALNSTGGGIGLETNGTYFWLSDYGATDVYVLEGVLSLSAVTEITSNLPINNTKTNSILNYSADISCSSSCANATLYFKNSTDTIHSVFTDLTGITDIQLGNEVNLSNYGSDGTYQWYYELTDSSNTIINSEERNILIDITAPYIDWNDPTTTTLTYATTYTLNIGVSNTMLKDVNLTVYNSTGSVIYNNFTSDINSTTFQISDIIPLNEGENTIEVYVIDQVLNAITDSKTIESDTTNPAISITSPTATDYTTSPTEITYTYTEVNCGSAFYSTDGGVTNSTNISCGDDFTGLTATTGSNTWTVYIRDLVGNIGSSAVTFTYTPSELPSYTQNSIYQILDSVGAGIYFMLFGTARGLGTFLIIFVIIGVISIIGYAIAKAIPTMIKNNTNQK